MNNDTYDNKALTGQNPTLKTKLRCFWLCKFFPTWEEMYEDWKTFKPEWRNNDAYKKSTKQYKGQNAKRETLVLPASRQSKD